MFFFFIMEEKTFTEDLCKTATGNKSVDVLLSSQNVLKLKQFFSFNL